MSMQEQEQDRPDPAGWWVRVAREALASGTTAGLPGRTGDSVRLVARRITEGGRPLWGGRRSWR